jgi:hypothetical protein
MREEIENFLETYKDNFIIKDDKSVLVKVKDLTHDNLNKFLYDLYNYQSSDEFNKIFEQKFINKKRKKFLGIF